jgi:hypothetical protein
VAMCHVSMTSAVPDPLLQAQRNLSPIRLRRSDAAPFLSWCPLLWMLLSTSKMQTFTGAGTLTFLFWSGKQRRRRRRAGRVALGSSTSTEHCPIVSSQCLVLLLLSCSRNLTHLCILSGCCEDPRFRWWHMRDTLVQLEQM